MTSTLCLAAATSGLILQVGSVKATNQKSENWDGETFLNPLMNLIWGLKPLKSSVNYMYHLFQL
jgi:hypothetical protein